VEELCSMRVMKLVEGSGAGRVIATLREGVGRIVAS